MASSISFEYLTSIEGANSGLATLDATGKLTAVQIPSGLVNHFKGSFALSTNLPATGEMADYAYVQGGAADMGFWYWNALLATQAWVNQKISTTAYNLLSDAEKSAVPYIIQD